MLPLILASSSETRKKQLTNIGAKFTSCSPNIDETVLENEPPDDLVLRLSVGKANAVSKKYKSNFIVAGDQVLVVGKSILGKPKNKNDAISHLQLCSGKTAFFYTGVCLFNSKDNNYYSHVVTTEVEYRSLSNDTINAYLEMDQPYSCAGSIQVESRGMLLLKTIKSSDPYSVLGLPMTVLSDLFLTAGRDLFLDYCS